MSADLRYPIGRFTPPTSATATERSVWIESIALLPSLVQKAVAGLADAQLDTPYRPGGWTVRQVVHHLPESHMNAYIRFKLSLTEENPRIKPYNEQRWSELEDAKGPIDSSLALLDGLHQRWVRVLSTMSEADWQRAYDHPEGGLVPLTHALALYAWHGRHHVAHVTSLRDRERW